MKGIRQALLALALVVVGLAPIAFLVRSGGDAATPFTRDEELPWPWCGPDASPSPSPPHPYPDDIVPLEDAPLIRAEPFADVVLLVAPGTEGLTPSEDPVNHPDHRTLAASISEVLLDRGFGDGSDAPVAAGSEVRLSGDQALLLDLIAASGSGPVTIGSDGRNASGSFFVAFGYDQRANEVLGSRSGESVVEEFIASRVPDEASRAQLIVDWNIEHASGSPGAVMTGFQDLVDEIFPPPPDLPAPGTMAYWDAAPPLCRSLLDAPTKILETLDGVSIAVHIPDSIAKAEDALICLRSDYGGLGCTVMRPNPDSDVVEFQAWRDPAGGPITVQLTREVDGSASWQQRTTLVIIPDDDLVKGQASVELPEGIAGATYDEIAASLAV